MRASDFLYLAFLAGLAVHIWLREISWLARAEDTWPILAGIPLFVWFQRPRIFNEAKARAISFGGVAVAGALYLVGILTNLTLVLALAWTLLLRAWLLARTASPQSADQTTKLLALPFFSFPWLSTDLNSVGWAFRLSGAAGVEHLFSVLQFDVVRHGTLLWVQGKSMSVDAACSGLNGLQSMLIAGTTLAFLKLRDSPRFWWNLPLLVAFAWLANTLRIIVLAFLAVEAELDIQNDFIHGLAGGTSLGLAFGLCWIAFALQEPKSELHGKNSRDNKPVGSLAVP